MPFDEDVRIALLETLRFAQLSDDEYHALYRTLARIPLSIFGASSLPRLRSMPLIFLEPI
jgi:hypothetical protein